MPDRRVSSWEEIGSRVAKARTRAGLTQDDVAQRLGLHRSAVARIERGGRRLDALELARLAETLGRSVAWFVSTPPPLIASHRRDATDDRRVEALEDELESAARDVELLLEINELPVPDYPELSAGTIDEACSAARIAREALDESIGPLHDLQRAVEEIGVFAFSVDLGPDTIDGAYVRVERAGVAMVNGGLPSGRRRFTLAHELGHHLLGDEYSTDLALSVTREGHEKLVNAFAIHFLAPEPDVRRRWGELHPALGPREALIHIAAEYRLSWSAACSHARNLELVDAEQRTMLERRGPTRADYIELGVTFEEELTPPAIPQGLARAVLSAYRKNKVGADRAVELLRGTVTADELPEPRELRLDALRSEFREGL